jgi:hypothetical protein
MGVDNEGGIMYAEERGIGESWCIVWLLTDGSPLESVGHCDSGQGTYLVYLAQNGAFELRPSPLNNPDRQFVSISSFSSQPLNNVRTSRFTLGNFFLLFFNTLNPSFLPPPFHIHYSALNETYVLFYLP